MKKLLIAIILFCFLMNSSSLGQSKCRILLFDDFVDNRFNWGISEEDKVVSFSIEDGYYYFEGHKKRRAYMALQHAEIDENKNFEIEASIKKISAARKNGYGICFGFEDAKNYYAFIINDEGEYTFFEVKDGETNKIIPWTKSESIKKGIETTNRLMIKNKEGVLNFYLNGSQVAVKPIKPFYGKKVGFYLQRKQTIAIDYFRVLYHYEKVYDEE